MTPQFSTSCNAVFLKLFYSKAIFQICNIRQTCKNCSFYVSNVRMALRFAWIRTSGYNYRDFLYYFSLSSNEQSPSGV